MTPEEAVAIARTETARAAARHAADGGREVVRDAALADTRAVGWRRVTAGGACKFCQLLAGRGAVYREDTVDFRSHDGCHCMPEPAFSEDVSPPDTVRRAVEAPVSDVAETLTEEEREAVFAYTSHNGYKTLNAALRDGRKLTAAEQFMADALNKAMGLRNGRFTTYRGMWTETADEFDALVRTFQGAEEVRLPGFQSTSFDPSYPVSMFAEGETGLMFEIRSRGGALLNDARLTTATREVEMVLPHNLTYRVVAVQENVPFETTFMGTPEIERRTLVILEEL